jgi:integrase
LAQQIYWVSTLVLNDIDFQTLSLRLLHAAWEVCRHLVATSEGRFDVQPISAVVLAGLKQLEMDSVPVERAPGAPKAPSNPRRMKLPSEYVEKFVAEKDDAAKKGNPKGLSSSFLDEKRDALRMLQELYPDKPIGDYTKADIAGFKDKLNVTPNRYAMVFKVPLPQAIELNKTAGRKVISQHTRERRLSAVKEFFSWARGIDLIEIDPAEGVEFIKTRTRKTGPKRKPFRLAELQKLFLSPLFTGCEDRRFWKKPGTFSMRDDHRFWLPLLALWTGARQGELAQLLVTDIQSIDGVWTIVITDEPDEDESQESREKRIKNSSSERKVPIHPELIQIGFLKFVARKSKAGERRLFSDCERDQNGRFGPHTKHFKQLLASVGVTREGVSFHSFRHGFEDAMRNSFVSDGAALQLTGRQTGTSRDGYGEGSGPKALVHWIAKVRYEGLDLRHLYDPAMSADPAEEAKS